MKTITLSDEEVFFLNRLLDEWRHHEAVLPEANEDELKVVESLTMQLG